MGNLKQLLLLAALFLSALKPASANFCVQTLTQHLTNEGYVFLKTSEFFNFELGVRVYRAMPHFVKVDRIEFLEASPLPGSPDFNLKFNSFSLVPSDQKTFEQFIINLDRDLKAALPGESFQLDSIVLRKWTAEQAVAQHEKREEASKWHQDGLYFTASIGLLGESTEITDEQGEVISAVEGDTVVMTNKDRAKTVSVPATVHRTPRLSSERVLLLIRYRKI